MINVLMIGAARDVRGGVSTVVNGYYEAGLQKKCQLTYLPTMKDGSKFYKLLVAIVARIRFNGLIKKNDILHVHLSNDASFYRKRLFILAAKKRKKKVVIHLHGSTFDEFYLNRCNDKQKAQVREVFYLADRVIALSDTWRDFIIDELLSNIEITENEKSENKNVNAIEDFNSEGSVKLYEANDKQFSKVTVIYNAVSVPTKYEKNYNNHNILFLGKLGQRKGTYELIEAMKIVIPRFPDLKLYLGGDGDVDEVQKIIKENRLGKNIKLIGWVRDKEKRKILRKCSIFTLPSHNEGMPMSVLEAMSYGCSVVSTYVGGIPHIISDGQNGYLINPGDVKDLSLKLTMLLGNEETRKVLGRTAKQTIIKHFDVKMAVEQVMDVYNSLIVK